METNNTEELENLELEKDLKRKEDILKLNENIRSNNFDRLKDRVAFILSYFPQSRNSDAELAWNYWRYFEHEILGDGELTKDKLFKLTKQTSLSRARAKIQNEYRLFQADPEVKKFRRKLREEFETDNVNDKPLDDNFFVYVDESGKTNDYLIIGSIWLFSFGPSLIQKQKELFDWKKLNDIKFEFHFKDLKTNNLNRYKQFVEKFIGLNPEISFKAIVLKRKGVSDNDRALEDLTTHLLYEGVLQEHNSNRAKLPRNLTLTVDREEDGRDKLKLANIKERIRSQKINGLHLLNFVAEDSFGNEYIQMADLLTASLNRIVNFPQNTGAKDEFARYLLSLLKVDVESFKDDNYNDVLNEADTAKIFNLN
ncbi:DUF3800 domain-containing protein [Sphingobacterium sp. BIGb0116]|uniref:DUF3800 domain-containing protein n=1 Tax=Sphingobacterium sp. BIGb0116 TaxID=2940619 RepID=UPI0021675753|nr:DUF3800 domain-containing protein [Sphingobacterium sp. BIGb0116]MCS4162951.1 hypothetical protein [Sphingobacterium sp. BIGb0116]